MAFGKRMPSDVSIPSDVSVPSNVPKTQTDTSMPQAARPSVTESSSKEAGQMVFGKRVPVAAPRGQPGEIKSGEVQPEAPNPPLPNMITFDYPWTGEKDWAACNFALGHLAVNIKQRLIIEGRLHAETLCVAIGAIAGFCAQMALNQLIRTGQVKKGPDYQILKAPDGVNYLYGEALHRYLAAGGRDPGLWSFVAAAAVQAGARPAELPELVPLFRAVNASMATHTFGVIEEPGHGPMIQPLQALNLLWPVARKCLTGKGLSERDWGQADLKHWPIIASLVAAAYVREMSSVLDPRIGAKLVMEAAFITCKVEPTLVVEGTFDESAEEP